MSLLVACTITTQPASNSTSASEGQEQTGTQGPACGKVRCAVGQVCCNPSCSVCTPPDGMCTQQACMDDAQRSAIESQTGTPEKSVPAPEPPAGSAVEVTCANVRCSEGSRCEMVQVQCLRAPCPPVPECKPDAAAATPTPAAKPRPIPGGVKPVPMPPPARTPARGQLTCGKNLCPAGHTCCNASCGICTPPGGRCIQMFCADGQMPVQ